MSALPLVLILLLVAGAIGVLATVTQMWAVGGVADDVVGPRRTPQRAPEAPVIVPGQLRSLIHGEAYAWKRDDQWRLLTQHLDELEAALGSTPTGQAPDEYSAAWLDQRIARIESSAGPLPAPLRPTPVRPTRRLPWKKK